MQAVQKEPVEQTLLVRLRSWVGRPRAIPVAITAGYWIFFVCLFQDTAAESGELAAAAMRMGTGPMPGHALLHQFTAWLELVPFGSPGGRLVLLNGVIMGLALYHFARLSSELLEEPITAALAPVGMFAGILFFRNTFFFSPIPITFLCVVLVLRLLEWPLSDGRRLWAAAFILGLGFVGAHPVFRLLLVPFLAYLLWMFLSHRTAVLGAPLFWLAGAAVAIAIPLTAHRFGSPLVDQASWSGWTQTLAMSPELELAGPRIASVHSFVWLPDLLGQLAHLGDSIPILLLPLVLAGLWPRERQSKFYVLLGLGLAEWAWALWMMPGSLGLAQTGWLLSAALWVSCARGVALVAGHLTEPLARRGFALFFLIAGPVATWLSDGGERFHLEAPNPRWALETAATLPTNATLRLPIDQWGQWQAATALLGHHDKGLRLEVVGTGEPPLVPGELWSPLLVDRLPAGWGLEPVTPIAGRLTPLDRLPDPASGADRLARSLLSPLGRQPSFVRGNTARLLAAWSEVFLHQGDLASAGRFASLARAVSPEPVSVALVTARLEAAWLRHENALLILRRALATDGSDPRLHAQLAFCARALALSGRPRPAGRRPLLEEARRAIRRALILKPDHGPYQKLMDELEQDLP